MLEPLARRRHRVSLIVATALAFALMPSAAALAAANYGLEVFDGARNGSETDAFVSGTAAEVPGPVRLVVRRGGAVVAQARGTYFNSAGRGSSEATLETVPAIGDVIEIYNPEGSSTPARSYTYTGHPSLDSCPVGSTTFGGKVDPNTAFSSAGAFRPGAGSGDPNRNNPGVVTQSGDNYTVTLARPLAAGDIVFVSTSRQVDPRFSYFQSASRNAGECVPQSVPAPIPTPAIPAPANRFDGVVLPLRKKDVKQGKNPRFIKVRVRCSSASTIPCRGTVGAQTVRRFAKPSALASAKRKKKRVTLATKKFSVAPGRSKVVTLKLTKPAYRLLKRQHRLKTRISVVTRNKAGKRLVATRTLTLKYKAKKKSKK
jgi:hypothetical protein